MPAPRPLKRVRHGMLEAGAFPNARSAAPAARERAGLVRQIVTLCCV